ncbi:hypothetical protein [Nocardioides solisilvae]|uniref:hypothetical protein n=1 Tax=Nocardioides solisilvae TaxID=1542435 RepID=UPI0013A562A3|nr:hypothetical protein [Nocardioides solisilvae]
MNPKKTLLLLLVVFLGFWMFTDPAGLADAAEATATTAWDLLVSLFEAIIDFFKAL